MIVCRTGGNAGMLTLSKQKWNTPQILPHTILENCHYAVLHYELFWISRS